MAKAIIEDVTGASRATVKRTIYYTSGGSRVVKDGGRWWYLESEGGKWVLGDVAHLDENPTKTKRGRNPSKKLSKLERAVKAKKAAVQRRVASALAKYLKQVNPSGKFVAAKVQKLKGGVLKITPIKAPQKGKR